MVLIICTVHLRQLYVSLCVVFAPCKSFGKILKFVFHLSIDETSGSSVDWFYEKIGVKIGYTFEFRDRRGGDCILSY